MEDPRCVRRVRGAGRAFWFCHTEFQYFGVVTVSADATSNMLFRNVRYSEPSTVSTFPANGPEAFLSRSFDVGRDKRAWYFGFCIRGLSARDS